MPKTTRRRGLAPMALLLAAGLAVSACRGCAGQAIGPVVVVSFENTTRNPALELWNDWLVDMLVRDLWQSEQPVVWSPLRSADLRRRADQGGRQGALEAAREQGAGLALFGSFTVEPSGVRIGVDLTEASSGRSLGRLEERANGPADVPATVDRLRDAVWKTLHVSPSTPARSVTELTTALPGAYAEFIAGEHLYHRAGYLAAAERYGRAATADPNFAQAHYRKATALMRYALVQDQDVQTALTLAWTKRQHAGERDRLAIEGLRALAFGKAEEAARVLNEVRRRWPGDKEESYFAALALAQISRRADSVVALQEAVRADPDFVPAWEVLADERFVGGDRDRAAEAIAQALRASPAEPRLLEMSATFDLFRGRLESAQATLDRAIRERQTAALILVRGNLRLLQGDVPGALVDFQAVRSPFSLATAELYQGFVLPALSQFDVRNRLELGADNRRAAAVGLWFAGMVMERNAEEELASRQFTAVMNLLPEFLDAQEALVVLYARRHDERRAGAILEALRDNEKKSQEEGRERHTLRAEASVALASGQFDRAIELLRRARDLSSVRFLGGGYISDRPLYTEALAEAYLAKGDLDGAAREFRAIADMAGDRLHWPWIWLGAQVHLAELAARQNRTDEAARHAAAVRAYWGKAGGQNQPLVDQALERLARIAPPA